MEKSIKPVKKPTTFKEKDITKIPTTSTGDILQTLARAGMATVPYVGGSAVQIFNSVITPPLIKRRDEWVQSIATRLVELEGTIEGFSIDNLSKNEVFITTVLHATNTAITNHHEEKLKALRNAVINSALPNPPEEDLQLMFINFIDSLTPWHLRVLSLLHNPRIYMDKNAIKRPSFSQAGLRSMIIHVFPDLKTQADLLNQIIRDLYSRGLIQSDSIGTLLSEGGYLDPQTTQLGRQFIAFITSD